jgi:B12-binding domain/radical SAM domain protein
MNSDKTCLIVHYKATSSYALNVILGAIESYADFRELEVRLVEREEELAGSIEDSVSRFRNVVVAWSFYSPEFGKMASDLTDIKKRAGGPGITHIVGGVHATGEPEQCLRAGFDIVAIGEGEQTAIELVRRISRGETLTGLRGTAYLQDDEMVSNGIAEPVDINRFPPYATKHRRFNPIEITRGCVYACKFCQTPFMFKAKFRHRTVENVCKYVYIMKEHGLKDVRFITPTSLSYGSPDESVNLDAIEELLQSVRSIVGSKGRVFFGTFPSEVRPEHVTPKALAILKKYVNNNNLIIGGQSGSSHVLDLSGRGHDVSCIIDAVRYSKEAGFLPNVDLIFGLPGEAEEDVEASLRLAERLTQMGARIHGHTFMPLPGTPFKLQEPGQIPDWAMEHLERLKSRGRLYGQWEQQIHIAQTLAGAAKRAGKKDEKEAQVQ